MFKNPKVFAKNAVIMIKRRMTTCRKDYEKMGLAASQARFLCITARKADCEYRSTELAQQKLDITKQMSDISNQYAQSMNATKLIWSHEGVDGDYSMSYGLMMTPSAANDFNPYLITSPSGAIVLNSAYADAARAAGISKAGGIGSQESRDKFIAALAYQGLVTEPTAKEIMKYDYVVDAEASKAAGSIQFNPTSGTLTQGVSWNPAAGMGATPLDKGGNVVVATLAELSLSESIGQKLIDWAILGAEDGSGNTILTKTQYEEEKARLNKMVRDSYSNDTPITDDIIQELQRVRNKYYNDNSNDGKIEIKDINVLSELKHYDNLIEAAKNYYNVSSTEGDNIVDSNGDEMKFSEIAVDNNSVSEAPMKKTSLVSEVQGILNGLYDTHTALETASIDVTDTGLVKTSANLAGGTYSIVQNGIIEHYQSEIEEITIGDILNKNIVLMAYSGNPNLGVDQSAFKEDVLRLFDSILENFGYSATKDLYGQGLYVDDASRDALQFAYDMIVKTYLDTNETVAVAGGVSPTSMTDNSTYAGAVAYNRLSAASCWAGVSLTNMLSSFLTYYENALSGKNSGYVVGKSLNSTVYVTDDPAYQYVMQPNDSAVTSTVLKSADFFDQLYNNILEHGWREDSAIDDTEYLESTLKDGRYAMSSLNPDGHYYQNKYNETGYLIEVSDTDAIERAEAEFSAMKAQLTFKEDSIDIKTKKLDAEISALSTEYETVKGIVSKCIEKTFAMFSN